MLGEMVLCFLANKDLLSFLLYHCCCCRWTVLLLLLGCAATSLPGEVT